MVRSNSSRHWKLRRAGGIVASIVVGAAMLVGCTTTAANSTTSGNSTESTAEVKAPTAIKAGFSWYVTHPVTKKWAQGIEEFLNSQEDFQVDFKVFDPNAKADVQVQQVQTMTADGYDVIFLQPIDSAALAAPVEAARKAGVIVVTLNIDVSATHAAHITQPHVKFSQEVGRQMAAQLNDQGNVWMVTNAQGTDIYNKRVQGFKDGLGSGPKIVGETVLEGADRKSALDTFAPVLQGDQKIDAIWCINDDIAVGVVQALKEAGKTAIVWGDGDGDRDAIAAVAAGEMSGTVFTDLANQGNIAAAAALAYFRAGLTGAEIPLQAVVDVPFTIVTKDNAATIPLDRQA